AKQSFALKMNSLPGVRRCLQEHPLFCNDQNTKGDISYSLLYFLRRLGNRHSSHDSGGRRSFSTCRRTPSSWHSPKSQLEWTILLDNAIKYAPEVGSILIRLSTQR